MTQRIHTLSLVAALALPFAAAASPLVYTPVNPSFGGNPFNGSVLLGEANVQNHYTDPSTRSSGFSTQQSQEDLFQSSLIASLQQEIFDAISAGASGSSSFGNILVEYTPSGSNTIVTITNLSTGASTEVTIPR